MNFVNRRTWGALQRKCVAQVCALFGSVVCTLHGSACQRVSDQQPSVMPEVAKPTAVPPEPDLAQRAANQAARDAAAPATDTTPEQDSSIQITGAQATIKEADNACAYNPDLAITGTSQRFIRVERVLVPPNVAEQWAVGVLMHERDMIAVEPKAEQLLPDPDTTTGISEPTRLWVLVCEGGDWQVYGESVLPASGLMEQRVLVDRVLMRKEQQQKKWTAPADYSRAAAFRAVITRVNRTITGERAVVPIGSVSAPVHSVNTTVNTARGDPCPEPCPEARIRVRFKDP